MLDWWIYLNLSSFAKLHKEVKDRGKIDIITNIIYIFDNANILSTNLSAVRDLQINLRFYRWINVLIQEFSFVVQIYLIRTL